jgi:hypothetical protein
MAFGGLSQDTDLVGVAAAPLPIVGVIDNTGIIVWAKYISAFGSKNSVSLVKFNTYG